MKDLIKYVSDKYAADWKRIGHFLDMPIGKLTAIERTFPANAQWCSERMFETWLQSDAAASWGKVFAAIDSLPIHNECEISVTEGS